MSLWDDIQPYLDPATGLLMAPDGGKDNLILLSAYLFRELIKSGEVSASWDVWCRISAYAKANAVAPGLIRKCPGGNMSEDNLVAIASILPARDILDRWNSHWGCFDCDNPNRFSFNRYWYTRHLGMKQFVAAAATGTCGWLGTLIWGISCVYTCLTTSGSSDALTLSLQVDLFEARMCASWATRFFRKRFSIPALYAEWFKSTSHPLVQWANHG